MDNVIPLSRTSNGRYEIVVLEPDAFSFVRQAIQALRANKAVILQLEALDRRQAQRLLDFISGSAYAISGHPSKVGEAVFLFTPYSIQVQSRMSSERSPAAVQ